MGMNAGALDRRVQIQRATRTPDGSGGMSVIWADIGPVLYARRRDVSDSERSANDWRVNELVSRFSVRHSAFALTIRRGDRLVHEGAVFEIDGIKEAPSGRAFLEITAMAFAL